MPVERCHDFLFSGLAVARQERGKRHHDAVRTIAALRGLFIDERLPDGRERTTQSGGFDRRDFAAFDRPEGRVAALHGVAVDQHGARAACPGAAPEPRSFEVEVIAQRVYQRRVRIRLKFDAAPVDRERDALHGQRLAARFFSPNSLAALPPRIRLRWDSSSPLAAAIVRTGLSSAMSEG